MNGLFPGEIDLDSSKPLHLLVDYQRISRSFSMNRRVDQAPDSMLLLVVEFQDKRNKRDC
jgi:hypothetical protein